ARPHAPQSLSRYVRYCRERDKAIAGGRGAAALKTKTASLNVAFARLRNQRLVGAPLAGPEEVVRWLGAVQSQDYAGAKWAVAQRAAGCRDADVEQACRDGRILRTHVLRPTWHFVLPE